MDENKLLMQISEMMESQTNQIAAMMEQQTKQIKLMVENDVTKRLDALSDGYQLTHEKQWELERRVEKIEKILENLSHAG